MDATETTIDCRVLSKKSGGGILKDIFKVGSVIGLCQQQEERDGGYDRCNKAVWYGLAIGFEIGRITFMYMAPAYVISEKIAKFL